MKNKILLILSILFVAISFDTDVFAAEILTDKLSSGVVGVSHNAPGKTLKVTVENGGKKYTYSLGNDGSPDYYPLQNGSGSYTISVLENISGNKYSRLKSETVNANISKPNDPYLQSIQIIKFKESDPAIVKAKSLGNNDKVYNYVVKNTKYDYKKAANVKPGYYPVINETYTSQMGICYDYSSMNAGMNRSLGVPTKLVKGYAKGVDGYHAWNEVFVNGKWQVVDTTYDSGMKGKAPKFKNPADYKKVYEY